MPFRILKADNAETFGLSMPSISITFSLLSHTFVHIGRIQPRIGDELVTNRREPILKIIADDVGWHDMLVPACDKQRYERYYNASGHRNCHDNFLEAMRTHNWEKREVPQPFNLFMNTFIEPDGTLHIRDPISKAGDVVVMIAEMPLIAVLLHSFFPHQDSAYQDDLPENDHARMSKIKGKFNLGCPLWG